jgi:hypothetical protein
MRSSRAASLTSRYHLQMLKDAPVVPYIPATNVSRAREFYEKKIGLVAKEEIAGGVVYECGTGSWIFLYQSRSAGTSQASQAPGVLAGAERRG